MKKLLTLMVVAVLALSALGVGYALWSETLTITGTVNTGSIGAAWSADAMWDDEAANKDVSSIECHVGNPAQSELETELYVNLTNAYPSINYYCEFNVEGTGTVPVHLIGPTVTNFDPCLEVGVTDLTSSQLHTGDIVTGLISVHLTNACEQTTTYGFSGELVYHQYNETP
jgi:hypothetical protein